MMNKVFMVGRLASDPQQFVTKNGITQSKITIATNDNWNKNESYFFPCVAWQTTANFINAYLRKGDLVAIDGKLIRRNYQNKEGKNVYVTEVVIETIKPLSSRSTNSVYTSPSSIDESYKPGSFSNVTNDTKNFSSIGSNAQNEFINDISIDNEQSSAINDDPFSISSNENDDSDSDVVNLDWLKDFSN